MARTPSAPADARRAIALLRGVNVGGRTLIRMDALKALMTELGYAAPQTLLQSGNVVFGINQGSRRERPDQIEAKLERELLARLSIKSDVFVRSAAEWDEIIAANPFVKEATSDPSHLLVVVLKDPPAASAVKSLQASIKGREVVRAGDRQLYVTYPDGIGTSKLTGGIIERSLGTSGTARNWNTVLKLAELTRA